MSVGAEEGDTGVRVEPRRRRRRWSDAEKRRIVEESLEPGTSVSLVARRHDVNANQVFTWRRQMRDGLLGGGEASCGFVPVLIGAESQPCRPAPELGQPDEPVDGAGARAQPLAGRMEIVVPGGRRVIVGADVDAAALARVLAVLEGRS